MSDSSHKERYPWSSREIEILIALWDNEDVLYNTRCADYFKRDKRIEALDRISDTLKIPIPEIRKKMTNLRTYYGKELWKEKKAQTNGEEADPTKGYTSRWQFFKPLNFLRDNCNPRQNSKTDSLDESCIGDDSENRQCKGEYGDDDDNDCDDTWDESNLLASLAAVDDEKQDSREETGVNSVSNEHRNNSSLMSKKRKKAGGDLENVIAKLQRSSKIETREEQKKPVVSITELTSGNPDMVFAHHVGLTLMNIKNPRMKDLIKLKIQQVLYETQYVEDTPQPVQAYSITAMHNNTC